MSNVQWYIEGIEFGNCNCSFGCPCQFEDLPTQGHCRGFEAVHIDRGYFGDVNLDGLRIALLYAWPGPIFEGDGEMQVIVDERADEAQRDALVKILHGEETKQAATHWWVYHAMSSTVHDPVYKPIEFECDIEARTARVLIPGVLESTGRPIVNPEGGEHRVRIDIPHGIEFELAEIGSASTKADTAIELDLEDSFGQFNVIRHSGDGVVKR
ncbi:MAG: DUF1326 domain-containing protein [Pseudomonadales bacterium]